MRLLAVLLCTFVASCDSTKSLDWDPTSSLDCRAELSAPSVPLLGSVDLRIDVFRSSGEKGDLAFEPAVPAKFEGAVEHRVTARGEGWIDTFTLELRPVELGTLEIPSFAIEHAGETVTTPKFDVEATSILRDSDDPVVLEDPAAPFPRIAKLWPYLVAAGALVVLGLLIWWWRKRSRRPAPLPVEVPLPPHVKALRALERLRQAERQTEAQIEVFYVDVSQILRVYLEERFGLHAPMRSTEEFLVEVEQGEPGMQILGLSHRQTLRNFLHQCDLVKFARLFPDVDVHERTLSIAEDFVEQTRDDVERNGTAALAAKTVGSSRGGVA